MTDTLYNALIPGRRGNYIEARPRGCRAGISGQAKHPGSKLSIGRLAAIHNDGAGHVPKRSIMYLPDAETLAGMRNDFKTGLKTFCKALPKPRRFTRGGYGG